MSDNKHNNTMSTTLETQIHEKNGVKLSYIPGVISKGTSVGNPILRPDLASVSREERFNYVGGLDAVDKLVSRYINAQAAVASREAFDEKEGTIDLKDWLSLIDGSGVAGETLDELRDRLEALRDEQESLFSDFMLAEPGDAQNAIREKLMNLKKEGQSIKTTIADKEEIARKRVAQRKANEAAKAATPVAA